jgi:hypothetical protein
LLSSRNFYIIAAGDGNTRFETIWTSKAFDRPELMVMRTFDQRRFSFMGVLGYVNPVILSNRRKNYKKTIKLFGELVFLLYLCGEIE